MTASLIHAPRLAIALAAAFGFCGAAVAQDAAPAIPAIVTPLASTNLTAARQPIVLPAKDARVIASIFEIAPGMSLPVHRHPFPRYAYVLAGELTVDNVETGESQTYLPGEFIVEVVDTWHKGTAGSGETVRLLVIDQVEGEAPNTLLRR